MHLYSYNFIGSGTPSANSTTARPMSGLPHTLQQQTLDTDKELSKLGGLPPIPHSQASLPWETST